MTKDLRNELEIALTNHNKKFEQFTQQAVNCEKEEEKELLFQKRWQFIHDYAQFLNDFVWNHKEMLNPTVTVLFDLVPNTVWNRMSENQNELSLSSINNTSRINSNAKTDFECRYIVISETLKQSNCNFDKCIDFTVNSLKQLIERAKYEIFYLNC